MNPKKLLPALLLALALLAAPGCRKRGGEAVPAGTSAPPGTSVSPQGSAAPQGSAGPGESVSPGTSAAPGTASSSAQGGTVPQQGPVLTVRTDSEAFDRLFAENPLDKKYKAEIAAAVSNLEMAKVSDRYAELWRAETDRAWAELQKPMKLDSSGKPAALEAEQRKWEDGREAALKKIADDAQAAGGSLAQVETSSRVMEFYRGRAAQLYRELYGYTQKFQLAYREKQ